jgi:NADH-quinone oxidoreductase subunit L
LHTWLPDAMEGPTPVSALIHAATMVTAGVFMVARLSPLFELAPIALAFVTIIGATTAFFAATVGLVQTDIKRVVAYSTCSQLGYMFAAEGVGAYGAGMFHLFTHASFKALLFLGAGAVIHALHHEQDMRRMGGLRKVLPFTFVIMLIGTLSLTGFPFTAGFMSKDAIIEATYAAHTAVGNYAFVLTLIAAALTSFYSWRLIFLVFHGERRWPHAEPGAHAHGEEAHHDHAPDHGPHVPHESPPVMTVPLILLAVGSVAAGALMATPVKDWLAPVFNRPAEESSVHLGRWPVTILTLVVVLLGAGLAGALFRRGTELVEQPAGPVVTAARNNLYADALNEAVFEKPGLYLTRALVYFDNRGLDGLVNGLAAGVGGGSGRLRRAQTGFVRSYALSMLGGALLVVAAMLAVTLG